MFRSTTARAWRLRAVIAGVGAVCAAGSMLISIILGTWPFSGSLMEPQSKSRVLASDDEWMQSVRSGEYFRNQTNSAPQPVPRERRRLSPRVDRSPQFYSSPRIARPSPEPPSGFGGTYRTMCVRLCDGYAWPISFATTSSNFSRDQKTCEQGCSSPAKLYAYPNPGGETDEMVDLSGKPYSELPTAYFYQAIYDGSCKCRPHPWEQQSLERHRVYALEERARKGDKNARTELRGLKASAPAEPRKKSRSRRRR